MKCPACRETNLLMTDRQGIEIDYCPQCRGVWLDRGELDKLIDRSSPPARQEYRENPEHRRGSGQSYPRDKRKHLLKELFDF